MKKVVLIAHERVGKVDGNPHRFAGSHVNGVDDTLILWQQAPGAGQPVHKRWAARTFDHPERETVKVHGMGHAALGVFNHPVFPGTALHAQRRRRPSLTGG